MRADGDRMDYGTLQNKLNQAPFYIYGTGIVGISVYYALKEQYGMTPVSFLVTSLAGNPSQIEEIPVQEALEAALGDGLILVAAPVEHHGAIGETLRNLGVSDEQIVFVDNALENRIMGAYYASLPEFETAGALLKEVAKADHEKTSEKAAEKEGESRQTEGKSERSRLDIRIYQAKCHVDRPLTQEETLPACICPIQVGAALTERSVADLKDNTGDNISRKNRDYCELTATYYAWKNSGAAYKGLCHYRRVFELDAFELEKLFEGGETDVILPYPTIHLPDISRQHSRYVSEPEWQAMCRAVEACEPSYAAEFDCLFSGRYFYNFNMLVAKAAVFDDYARWMFGILERTEEIIARDGIATTKRYAGYLGENLTTLYFRRNRERLKIVHTGRRQLT